MPASVLNVCLCVDILNPIPHMDKIIINWELSLFCNLDCSFCSQGFRRKKQKSQLSFEDIAKIIKHLPE